MGCMQVNGNNGINESSDVYDKNVMLMTVDIKDDGRIDENECLPLQQLQHLALEASDLPSVACDDDDQDDGRIDDNECLPLQLEGEQHQPEASKEMIFINHVDIHEQVTV